MYHVCVLNLQPFKILFYLQARVSNSNDSCKDNASGTEKKLKRDQFQFTQEQPLQNDDTGNITCTENSKGTGVFCRGGIFKFFMNLNLGSPRLSCLVYMFLQKYSFEITSPKIFVN